MINQLAYTILNAPLRTWPFPHVYVPDVFPADVYGELRQNMPDLGTMIPISEARPVRGYKERFVQDISGPLTEFNPEQRAFWGRMASALLSGSFRNVMLSRFRPFVEKRFPDLANAPLYDESLLVEDITNYALGPHTDTPAKVITVLFYLPPDDSQRHLGTSLYVPKDPRRRCPGGPHYPHADFERVVTFPFLPNSMMAFFKTDNSFHGVEPVTDPDVRRWLLLYDVRVRMPRPAAAGDAAKAPATVA